MTDKFVADRELLYATLPSDNTRYVNQARVKTSHTVLPIAAHLSTNGPAPAYHNCDWQLRVHPEGKPYYSRGIAPTVIAEGDLSDADVAEQIDAWTTLIAEICNEKELRLHPGVELFLQLDPSDDSCFYYFIDHESRGIFYLEAFNTDALGLPPSCCEQHLKQTIQQNYWQHVEMFPMHLTCLPGALDELLAIFLHGQMDHMTSSSSTFPYSKAQCSEVVQVLKISRKLPQDPNMFVYIARLWANIAGNRFLTHYGEDHCRLDRLTTIVRENASSTSRMLQIISRLLFHLPDDMRDELDGQLVDDLATRHVWQAFIEKRLSDWKQSMQWLLALLIAHALTVTSVWSPSLAHFSMLLCATGLLFGGVLCARHHRFADTDTPQAANFLEQQRTESGFQRLGTLYSIPKAFFIWAVILFTIQLSCTIFCPLPQPFGLLAAAVFGASALAVFRILYPTCFRPRFFSRLSFAFRKTKEDAAV